jgi:class 3 adenylate cyclase/Tfp pilus assembly protein PilF
MNAAQQVLDRVLAALRQWGWEAGLAKLKEKEVAGPLDAAGRAALRLVRQVLAAERGAPDKAPAKLRRLEHWPELLGWARAGQALAAMRHEDYRRAHELLDQAAESGPDAHPTLRATVAHHRGAVLSHEDQPDAALGHLHQALELFGKEHFVTGRVLDTLGMAYAAKDTFSTAREFYERAIACKQRWLDRQGLALSHGQLGRLALDWGDLAEAEKHFQADLELALDLGDARGAAVMYANRGSVALAAGRASRAADFLDESIRRSRRGGWAGVEGYAHSDRALAYLAAGDLARAEQEAREAEKLFRSRGSDEGLAHVNRVRGQLLRARGRFDEAEQALRDALTFFEGQGRRAEVARTQWERAHLARARGAPVSLVADALLRALDSAERCRRHALVRQIEAELRQLDEAEYCRRVYQRVRGRAIAEETASLLSGHRETATVLFLDLQGSTDYMRVTDPEVVMMTINQMMANLAGVLERHGAGVTAYLGDGFMALVRGRDHARRAVAAALDLGAALAEFNRPRRVLELPLLEGRLGVSTGEVFLGNVGTYQKMDFTALGTTVNLAARLQPEAEPGQPCISRQTYEHVQEHFAFRKGSPRTVSLKGLGPCQVWDVVGPVP